MEHLHISISAERLVKIGGLTISNSLLVSLLVSIFLIIFAIWFKGQSEKKQKPGLYVLAVTLLSGLLKFFEQIAGEKRAKMFFPLLTGFFIYILFSNWSGILPGVGTIGFWEKHHGEKIFIPLFRGPTADLNTTLALAIISVAATQYFGIKILGVGDYLKKYINFTNPIKLFIGILEVISEFAKIMSFSFRLFGNIFAGEVLLVVMGALVPFLAPLPFLGLEIFVGLVQAVVFVMLSLVFMTVATTPHNNH